MQRWASIEGVWGAEALIAVQGLKPVGVSPSTGEATIQAYSLGRMAGDFYQGLLKAWLMTGKADARLRTMWVKAMDNMLAALMFASTPSRLKYIADFERWARAFCLCLSASEGALHLPMISKARGTSQKQAGRGL